MKRHEFIQKISFLGVGLSVTPWKLISAKPSIQTFTLPKPAIHIPHGNFATTELDKLVIPELNLECTVQQFMRNGIEQSDADLKVFSIQSNHEWITIAITRDGQVIKKGKISGMKVSIDSFDDPFLSISKE